MTIGGWVIFVIISACVSAGVIAFATECYSGYEIELVDA